MFSVFVSALRVIYTTYPGFFSLLVLHVQSSYKSLYDVYKSVYFRSSDVNKFSDVELNTVVHVVCIKKINPLE